MAALTGMTIAEFKALSDATLPLVARLGIAVERLEPGRVVARMAFQPDNLRPGGTVSGPAMMGLADYTMYALVMSLDREAVAAVTININVNFLQKPPPGAVIAEGRMIKLGRRLAVAEVTLHCDDLDGPVAHATGTYSLPPR